MNPFDLSGKSVVVTGASSGIGRSTSIYLSQLGARVVLVGRDRARLDETFAALETGPHRSYVLDLAEVETLPSWLKQVATDVGPLYGLVHSAGIALTRPLKAMTYRDYSAVLRVNLDAAVMLSKGFRQKGVREESGASIVYVSSAVAFRPQPALAAYAASKGALISLAKALSRELAVDKIRVNCVCPGLVQTSIATDLKESITDDQFATLTKQYPLGIGTSLDVSYAIAFLLAPAARWITGTALVTDGGYSA
jgi:NAD(P)-dependent dehydrogenase (short-subunit alcohol dehydrogenase family)